MVEVQRQPKTLVPGDIRANLNGPQYIILVEFKPKPSKIERFLKTSQLIPKKYSPNSVTTLLLPNMK